MILTSMPQLVKGLARLHPADPARSAADDWAVGAQCDEQPQLEQLLLVARATRVKPRGGAVHPSA
jgi:hypothetical protein